MSGTSSWCDMEIFLMKPASFSFPSDSTTFSWKGLRSLFYLSLQSFLLWWKISYTLDYDEVSKCQLADHLARGRWGNINEPPALDFPSWVHFSLGVSEKQQTIVSFLCVILCFTSYHISFNYLPSIQTAAYL